MQTQFSYSPYLVLVPVVELIDPFLLGAVPLIKSVGLHELFVDAEMPFEV